MCIFIYLLWVNSKYRTLLQRKIGIRIDIACSPTSLKIARARHQGTCLTGLMGKTLVVERLGK